MQHFEPSQVPEIIFDSRPQWKALYYEAWKIASGHIIRDPKPPFLQYMDEGASPERVWIWDSCLMALYCKYAPEFFPGMASLDNLYMILHDKIPTGLKIHHPDNPPLFGWAELGYYRFHGDRKRAVRIFEEKKYLQKHYEFFENCHAGTMVPGCVKPVALEKKESGYLWAGCPSGMDNTPRGRGRYDSIFWVDALAQQAHSAHCIAEFAAKFGDAAEEQKYRALWKRQCTLLNQYYWDEKDGTYYDIFCDTHDFCKVLTPASFWPLLAGAAEKEQIRRMISLLRDPDKLGGVIPSVSRDDPDYNPAGGYWRGGVWLPVVYMIVSALNKACEFDLAAELSEMMLERMVHTWENTSPHTIWESYSPSQDAPSTKSNGQFCRTNFCGWSALAPISMLIENVMGFYDISALEQTIRMHWRKIGRFGIRNLKFGTVCCDIIADDMHIRVTANQPVALEIDGRKYPCGQGETVISGPVRPAADGMP